MLLNLSIAVGIIIIIIIIRSLKKLLETELNAKNKFTAIGTLTLAVLR